MSVRLVLVVAAVSAGALAAAACRRQAAPAEETHLVIVTLDDEVVGQERATVAADSQRQRFTIRTRTLLSGPAPVSLEGTLVVERGRPISLDVSGLAPPPLPAAVRVTITPDRTDVFPLRGPLPFHVVAVLVRQSIVGGRREYRLLPDGTATVEPCPGGSAPFPDATCHVMTGLDTGTMLIWLDRRQALAAAAAGSPLGTLVATAPGRESARARLLERFDVYSAREESSR